MLREEGHKKLPEWPEMIKTGMAFEDYQILMKEESINKMKLLLSEYRDELSDMEIAEAKKAINIAKKELEE
ncbi:hypothetical protein [Numidum massiliense]|uniref:hypothetical protein n=1 Tax=Numidum massiliense TaxID=1522315 RepID=UPI0006D55DF8|nr:hypothetical protein [Numidum massiliense]